MTDYLSALRRRMETHPLNLGDADSVLTMLYEAYSDCNPMVDAQIKVGFYELYRLMNGAPLEKMDEIINPVCFLCREHERSGFVHGVRIGILLARELAE